MLYYDRIDVSERIYINKASASKECDICHYCHFLDKEFKFQLCVCNWCHDVIMMSNDLNDIVFSSMKCVDYCCIINRISKSDALNLL